MLLSIVLMIAVVDTSVLIDHLRGHPRASRLLDGIAQSGEELWSVTVVRTEILAGMLKREERATLDLLEALRWQDVTVEIADRAGQLARRFLRSHRGVDTVDYLIAAAAMHLGGRLLTQNVRHFPMFEALLPAY